MAGDADDEVGIDLEVLTRVLNCRERWLRVH